MKYVATFWHKLIMLIWWGINILISIVGWALTNIFLVLWHMNANHCFRLIGEDWEDNFYYEITGNWNLVKNDDGEWINVQAADYYYRNPKDLLLSRKTYK